MNVSNHENKEILRQYSLDTATTQWSSIKVKYGACNSKGIGIMIQEKFSKLISCSCSFINKSIHRHTLTHVKQTLFFSLTWSYLGVIFISCNWLILWYFYFLVHKILQQFLPSTLLHWFFYIRHALNSYWCLSQNTDTLLSVAAYFHEGLHMTHNKVTSHLFTVKGHFRSWGI